LKNAIRNAPREISTIRGNIYTWIFSQHPDRSILENRSLAFRTLMEELPAIIFEGELLVGSVTEKRRGALLAPETNTTGLSLTGRNFLLLKKALSVVLRVAALAIGRINQKMGMKLTNAQMLLDVSFDTPASRKVHPFVVGNREAADIQDTILPYWKKRTAVRRFRAQLERDEKSLIAQFAYSAEHAFGGGVFLFHPNIEQTAMRGLNALVLEAREYLARTGNPLYQGIIDTCTGVLARAEKYAREAERLALQTVSPERKKELQTIADVCRRVPAYPPETFQEGIQSLWFLYTAIVNDDCGHEIPFGRWDQMLYPLYAKDLKAGRITRAGALELLECFLLKTNELEFFLHNGAAFFEDGNTGRLTLTIGGVDRDGNDATNALSYMFLEALSNCRMIQPNPAIRLHKGSPEKFINLVTGIMASGANTVQLFNDETVITGFSRHGYPVADARDYIISGCVQQLPAAAYGSVCAAHLVLPRTLEIFLGKKGSYATYDDFHASYTAFLAEVIRQITRTLGKVDRTHEELLPTLFVSAGASGPMQSGRDVKSGGGCYNMTGISLLGLGTLADSLVAIKKAVYEEQKFSLSKLIRMLAHDFTGYAQEQMYLVNKIPKYGNDNDEVDMLAREMADFCAAEVAKYTTWRKGKFSIGVHSENGHVVFGFLTGATPDGRKAMQPYSIGAGSARGQEKNGYTATLKSVAKLNMNAIISGVSVNLRFSPALLAGDGNLRRFSDMLRTYFFDLGGQNLMTTVIDTATLRQAQLQPHAYPDLLVRISGYSARFVELSKMTQDEIISRTEYAS
jgi:formate C-acetyltransferase